MTESDSSRHTAGEPAPGKPAPEHPAPERELPWWGHLSAPEAAEVIASDPVAVLPLAAVEQHGPHLPLSTDVDIGMGLLREAAREGLDPRIVILPPVAVGTSTEHVPLGPGAPSEPPTGGAAPSDAATAPSLLPGTLSLDPETLTELLVNTGASLAASGIRRLVVSNSHGGNKAVLDTAALRLRREYGMLVVKASWFRFPRPAADSAGAAVGPLTADEWEHGLHGGAVETAMMLHLHPERVRRGAVRDFPSLGQTLAGSLEYLRPEGPAAFAWMAGDLNPDGVTGNASLATPEMGAALVAHYGRILRDVIQDALRFPLDALR